MKHQEFLLCGIPQVCSNVAISEFVEDNVHVLIANQGNWKNQLRKLIDSRELRESLGQKSTQLFHEYYTYDAQFGKLKTVLLSD